MTNFKHVEELLLCNICVLPPEYANKIFTFFIITKTLALLWTNQCQSNSFRLLMSPKQRLNSGALLHYSTLSTKCVIIETMLRPPVGPRTTKCLRIQRNSSQAKRLDFFYQLPSNQGHCLWILAFKTELINTIFMMTVVTLMMNTHLNNGYIFRWEEVPCNTTQGAIHVLAAGGLK